MATSKKEYEIEISISGRFDLDGPTSDYTQLFKGISCLIAMDLDRNGNTKTQYLIALLLFENLNSSYHATIEFRNFNKVKLPSSLILPVNIKRFTVHPYASLDKLPKQPCNRKDSIKYFLDNNTFVKMSYHLTIDVGVFLETNRSQLVSKGYSSLLLSIDDEIIGYLKYLRNKSSSKTVDVIKLSSFLAEKIKTLGEKILRMRPPIMNELNAALESKLDLNNVK